MVGGARPRSSSVAPFERECTEAVLWGVSSERRSTPPLRSSSPRSVIRPERRFRIKMHSNRESYFCLVISVAYGAAGMLHAELYLFIIAFAYVTRSWIERK